MSTSSYETPVNPDRVGGVRDTPPSLPFRSNTTTRVRHTPTTENGTARRALLPLFEAEAEAEDNEFAPTTPNQCVPPARRPAHDTPSSAESPVVADAMTSSSSARNVRRALQFV